MKQGAHGGNVFKAAQMLGVTPQDIFDYSSNVSPFQVQVLKGADINSLLSRLPEPYSETLLHKYTEKYGMDTDSAVITAGTTEAIEKLCRIYEGKKALIFGPTYSDYEHYCRIYGLDVSYAASSLHETDADICFICNPNNPTGKSISKEEVINICSDNKKTLFAVDESYVRFHKKYEDITLIGSDIKNLIILRSYSKTYGLPGLRMGAAVSVDKELISSIRSLISPWSVNCAAQAAGIELLDADVTKNMRRIHSIMEQFISDLKDISFIAHQGTDVNFLLCRLDGVTSEQLFTYCLKNRVLIRDCANFNGLDNSYVRFAAAKDMSPLLECLKGFQK